MLVVILGCGPAGLAAAKAAVSLGYEVLIISRSIKPSPLYGCQYLHAPIPGYEDVPHVRVSYGLNGTPEQYRKKVYGEAWSGRVSPEDFIGEHDAWDIRNTYMRLWADLINGGNVKLIEGNMTEPAISGLERFHPNYIISTIPATVLCRNLKHHFRSIAIWANGSTSPDTEALIDNSILCDGTGEREWYRISNVFGYRTMEWADRPLNGAASVYVKKPISTNCDCHPSIIRAGRYGTWSKSYLVHQVYQQVIEALKW